MGCLLRLWSGGDGVGGFGAAGDSVGGVEGWEGRVGCRLWGLNGGWMGALGMVTCERVGGFCRGGGWRVGMLLHVGDGGIVVCGWGWEG